MTDRPILKLPDPRPAQRAKGRADRRPRPKAAGGARPTVRAKFERLEQVLAQPDGEAILRADPNGIAPDRALVFVTAAPIQHFIKAANAVGLEVLSEIDLGSDYALPEDLDIENREAASPTLYATMPNRRAFSELLRLWRAHQRREPSQEGLAPLWAMFDLLADLRPWGPEDRLTAASRVELENRLPFEDDAEVHVELEVWPTANREQRAAWRRETEARIVALGGRQIASSTIEEDGFVYEGILVGLAAAAVREMIADPSGPRSIAALHGLQFVLPQTVAQALPDASEPREAGAAAVRTPFDDEAPIRAVLLDGTPIAAHPDLDGGVVIEDVHDLVRLSTVAARRHATAMASLILRGDLEADGLPVADSRLLSIPILIDENDKARSPDDKLFLDVVHTALLRAFAGDQPLTTEAFVVNFSVGIRGSHFAGQMSSLARLLDWWAATAGVLFVVSAGNVPAALPIQEMGAAAFEDAPLAEKRERIGAAIRERRHDRTLLAPAEALNAITVGAASLDAAPPAYPAPRHLVAVQEDGECVPALSGALGLGPLRSIKPDLIAIGGVHDVRAIADGAAVSLRVVEATDRSGLHVATAGAVPGARNRSRGTSCATAMTTRAILSAAAAMTEPGGPYEGQELGRQDMALLTRALAVSSARWPASARALRDAEAARLGRLNVQAKEEVVRQFGHGLLEPGRMREAPVLGTTLVGLGSVKKDRAVIFDLPLPPSLAGQRVRRRMNVTLAWFSPVAPVRAQYRLAALDAIPAEAGEEEDQGWQLAMKSGDLDKNMIRKSTVWSRRLVNERLTIPAYDDETVLPIRVQCRDAAGGGLSPDAEIRFALAVSLEAEVELGFDIHEEIEQRLRVILHGTAGP